MESRHYKWTLSLNYLRPVKNEGIHTCLDTSAGVYSRKNKSKHRDLLKYTDLVLLDIKHIDNDSHRWLVGISNQQVLDFAHYLDELQVKTVIRHVLLPGINADVTNLTRLRTFIDGLSNVVGIDILPYHKAGTIKWDKLGIKYELGDVPEPNHQEIQLAEKDSQTKLSLFKIGTYKFLFFIAIYTRISHIKEWVLCHI